MTGTEIRERRKRLGWTQWRLAREVVTTTNNISRWELEDSQPTGLYAINLEKALTKGERQSGIR